MIRRSVCLVLDLSLPKVAAPEPCAATAYETRFSCSVLEPFSPEFVEEMRGLYAEHLTMPRICYIPRPAIPASARQEVAEKFFAATGQPAYIVNMAYNMIIP